MSKSADLSSEGYRRYDQPADDGQAVANRRGALVISVTSLRSTLVEADQPPTPQSRRWVAMGSANLNVGCPQILRGAADGYVGIALLTEGNVFDLPAVVRKELMDSFNNTIRPHL